MLKLLHRSPTVGTEPSGTTRQRQRGGMAPHVEGETTRSSPRLVEEADSLCRRDGAP
jgi:hypothetical protein